MAKTKLQWALEMRARGLRVFPLTHTLPDGSCSCGQPEGPKHKPKNWGKHPLPGSRGVLDATDDPDEIEALWTKHPNANIGVAPGVFENADTGGELGTIIVDLDEHVEGISGAKNLGEKLQDEFLLASSFCVRTQSGGYQLYYTTDENFANNAGKVLPGVDIRSKGGYGIAPGSVIQGREYTIHNEGALEPLPEPIKTLLTTARVKDESSDKELFELDRPSNVDRAWEFLRLTEPAVEDGTGDNHTYATAQIVKDFGISEEKCLDLMMEVWSPRCDPPWTRDELEVKVANAYAYGKDSPGSKGGVLGESDDDVPSDVVGEGYDPKNFTEGDSDRFEYEEEAPKREGPGKNPKLSPHIYDSNEYSALPMEYHFIIPNWFPGMGVTGVRADRGAGKSTVILDMCMCLACDLDWHDLKAEKGWTIFYIIGEDAPGIHMRMNAWKKKFGRSPAPGRFYVMDMKVPLTDGKFVKQLADEVKAVTKRSNRIIFVLDTWQRMTDKAESQSNEQDINNAVGNVEALTKMFKGPALIAFHPPKDKRQTIMGSSIIENITHSIIGMEKLQNEVRKLTVERLKGGEENKWAEFRFEKIELGGEDWAGNKKTGPWLHKTAGSGSVKDEQAKRELDTFLQVLGELAAAPHVYKEQYTDSIRPLDALMCLQELPALAVKSPPVDEFCTWLRMLKEVRFEFLSGWKSNNDTWRRNQGCYRGLMAAFKRGGPYEHGFPMTDGTKWLRLEKDGKLDVLVVKKSALAEADIVEPEEE